MPVLRKKSIRADLSSDGEPFESVFVMQSSENRFSDGTTIRGIGIPCELGLLEIIRLFWESGSETGMWSAPL